MKYAWLEGSAIRDICPGDPAGLYHPDIAKFYDTEVPDDAVIGSVLVNGQWYNPNQVSPSFVPSEVVPQPKQVSPVEFMLLFTSSERVALRAVRSTDPVIDDWLDIVNDPRLTHVDLGLQSTKDALSYAVSIDILTETRREEILTGVVQ